MNLSTAKFNVRRSGNTVRIKIQLFQWINLEHWFTREYSDEQEAELAYSALETALSERIAAIRRSAYERGFADARAKRKKRTYFFSGCVNQAEIGG